MTRRLKANFKLKEARAENNLTQEAMARLLGISRLAYGQKENGLYPFTEPEMQKSCVILKKDPTELFFNN